MQMSAPILRVNLLIPKILLVAENTLEVLLLDVSSELGDENSSP